MESKKTKMSIEKVVPSAEDGSPSPDFNKIQDRVVLIPRPLDDPRDPLNWSFRKKCIIVATLSIAMFAGYAAPFCGQLNLTQQAKLYHKTVVEITYFVSSLEKLIDRDWLNWKNSAASAGLASGGFFYSPLSHKFGRSSVIFWAVLGCLATQIWAPLMTGEHQYWPYFVSRYFAGFFGMVVSVLGPRYLVDLFFLHQRGRAFTILHLALNFGASAGPTFSGFIAANNSWTIEYWWSVGLLGFTAFLVLLFLEEAGFDRTEGATNVIPPDSFLQNRIYTFFPGNRIVKPTTLAETVRTDW
jgi:MFS family permease